MRKFTVAVVVLALAAVPAISAAGSSQRAWSARISVKPPVGSPTTQFVVSFKAPQRTGGFGPSRRLYALSVEGPAHTGCSSGRSVALPGSRRGVHVRVRLGPSGSEPPGGWCPGTYHGRVQALQTPSCPLREVCPAYVVLLGTVGRFSFRVQAPQPPPGRDRTPPSFMGIQSANACTPGPQRPGQTTPMTLGWNPAADDVTPSSAIVYDIFFSTTPGGEDFSKPAWTTPPGATTYKTPGLPSHGTFYFVVRARDQAGNEDHNTVERRGSDPCL